jgi:hypothetical protein
MRGRSEPAAPEPPHEACRLSQTRSCRRSSSPQSEYVSLSVARSVRKSVHCVCTFFVTFAQPTVALFRSVSRSGIAQ